MDLSILMFIMAFGFLPILLSLPAFYFLKKRKMFFLVDLGAHVYGIMLYWLFLFFGNLERGLSDVFTEPLFICAVCVVVHYGKLFLGKNKRDARKISMWSIVFILLIAVLSYFFFPVLPE